MPGHHFFSPVARTTTRSRRSMTRLSNSRRIRSSLFRIAIASGLFRSSCGIRSGHKSRAIQELWCHDRQSSQGYSRIGMSLFDTIWPTPHRKAAAGLGRKLGADLVLYVVVPAGTRATICSACNLRAGSNIQCNYFGCCRRHFRVIPNQRLFAGKLPHKTYGPRRLADTPISWRILPNVEL